MIRRFLAWLFGRRPSLNALYRRDKATTLLGVGTARVNHDNRTLR